MKLYYRNSVFVLILILGIMSGCRSETLPVSDNAVAESDAIAVGKSYGVVKDPDHRNELVVRLVSIETKFESGTDVAFIFSIENNTPQPVELLPWRTPLESVLSADVFDVMFEGELLPYAGRMAKRPVPIPSDYITIAAGEKKQMKVNFSQSYATDVAGLYSIQLKSNDGLYEMYKNVARVATAPLIIERR